MVQKQRHKREEYVIQIGPLLKKVLDEQIERIRKVTYNVRNPSYYESGEIVAKKVLGMV